MKRSKSTLVVLIMGIMALAAMGLVVKFAFDSNPALAEVIQTKRELAEQFGGSGLDELSIRTLPRRAGYHVRAVFGQITPDDGDVVAESLARAFLERFDGRRRRTLRVELVRESSFGCQGESVVCDREFDVPDLVRTMRVEGALEALRGRLDEASGLRVVSAEPTEGDGARLVFVLSPGTAADASESGKRRQLLTDFVVKSLEGVPVRVVTLVVRSTLDAETALEEWNLDLSRVRAPTRSTRRVWRIPTGSAPAPSPGSDR